MLPSLDREGFALKEFRSGFDRFDQDDTVRSEFYPLVAEFVRTAVGARRVIVFDHVQPMTSGVPDGLACVLGRVEKLGSPSVIPRP